jgi:pilus assembly protein TadC
MRSDDRRERTRIVRAVRRGQVLTTREDAEAAVKVAIAERRGLPRVRLGYLVVGLLAAVGIVVGLVGPSWFLPPSAALLIFIVAAFALYLPKLDRNLARAARLNRKAAQGEPVTRPAAPSPRPRPPRE